MPHVTLEHTTNLPGFDAAAALATLNAALATSGHFQDHDIKSRAIALPVFRVGTADAGHAFVHVTLSLLSGRDEVTRQAIAQRVLDALVRCVPASDEQVQCTVELRELARASYAKQVLGGAAA